MKKRTLVLIAVAAFIFGCMAGCVAGGGSEASDSSASTSANQYEDLNQKYTELKKEYSEYKEKMEPYEDLEEKEAKVREVEAEEKLEEQKKKEEEEAAAAQKEQEEKEKKGYDTGITYDQLARTPDDYEGEKVKFSGEVVQVMEDDGTTAIRLAVNEDYDNILIGVYDSNIVSSRILENDKVTIYGISTGLYSYETVMGDTLTIPSVQVEKIER